MASRGNEEIAITMAHTRILAVEDDDFFGDYLSETLTDLGYEVLPVAATGEDAVVRAKAEKPDLILMDITLAGEMDGIAAAAEILSFSDVPLIYLTGHFEPPVLKKAGVTAPYGYMAKPFSKAELSAVIEMALSRHALELKLRESENRLRIALTSSRMGVWEWDREMNSVFWSPEYRGLVGCPDNVEPSFESFIQSVHPEDRAATLDARRQISVDKPHFFSEFRLYRYDGEMIWVQKSGQAYFDSAGTHVRTVGTLRDVTEQKQKEEQLLLLKRSIDIAPDGAYWTDSEGRFLYVNDAGCKLSGYSREELLTIGIGDLNERATPARWSELWQLAKKQGSFTNESTYRRKDGTEVPVEAVAGYVELGGEEFAFGFARDVTEKKRLEDQLRQAEKMEAIGTLAGGVAHDFNNLLTVILGFSQLIQADDQVGKETKSYADRIVESSNRAAELTQSLLAFSRKQRIEPTLHSLNDVVSGTTKLLRRLLPEDIELTLAVLETDVAVSVDVTQINQVMMNLVTNARDAMPDGGTLAITLKVTEIDRSFIDAHGFGQPGSYTKLTVADSGSGIDPEILDHVFEPFFTTKEVGKGTGLGLASAYGIVKQHNGYIVVSSKPGKGTTVDIYLPVPHRQPSQETTTIEEANGGSETILLVEDDPAVRNLLGTILERGGYTVIGATDGDDALRVYEKHRARIDLVVLDVVMPGRNGKEVLEEIARSDPHAKALFMSGYTGDVVIGKGIHTETVDFLQKPLTVNGLLSKVREVLDR
jgi:two-component system, cell cycle sensor histidine kinase and response regulator CckA